MIGGDKEDFIQVHVRILTILLGIQERFPVQMESLAKSLLEDFRGVFCPKEMFGHLPGMVHKIISVTADPTYP